MFLMRHAVALAALTTCVAAPPGHGQTWPPAPRITCTNPSSGASWQIIIDYDQATVDSNPARISPAEISWHNGADGGNYTLDRRSGKLTVAMASSTGGYFLYHDCRLPSP